MNIVQVITKPQRRGAEIFAHELSCWLDAHGESSTVVALYEHLAGPKLTMRKQDVELAGNESARREALLDPLLLARLVRSLRVAGADIVQANGGRAVKYVAAARAFLQPRTLFVYRNIDQPSFWVRSRVAKTLLPLIVRAGFDAAIAVSKKTLCDVRTMYGFENSSIAIENGVDFSRLRTSTSDCDWRARHALPRSAPLLIFAGALNAQKRPDVAVELLARLQHENVHLVMLGDGPWRTRVVAESKRRGCRDRLHLLGNVDDVGAAFAAGAVFVTTSDTEGIPAVVIEAQHCGLPVVGFDVGGMRECVADGETGTLVGRGDVEGAARAVDDLLTDGALRLRQASAARSFSSRFSIEAVGPRYVEFYQACLAKKRPNDKRQN